MASKLNAVDYIKAMMRLQLFSHRVVASFGRDFDVLLTPTTAMEPPNVGWLFETGESDPERLLWRCSEMVPYSGWYNVTGLPAISLPVHISATGLPIGAQLVGSPYREDTLLQLAQQMESMIHWQDALPR